MNFRFGFIITTSRIKMCFLKVLFAYIWFYWRCTEDKMIDNASLDQWQVQLSYLKYIR